MSKPLTLTQATLLYECEDCRTSGWCGEQCVYSSTTSLVCVKCGHAVYFGGNASDIPDEFACPYCKHDQKNPWPIGD